MQNSRKRSYLFIWLLILFFIVMACDTSNVDPEDERLQEPVQNLIENFETFYGNIGVNVKGSTPYIKYVVPIDSDINQNGKIKYEITVDEKFHKYISIFSIKPQGCERKFADPQKITTFENTSTINGNTTDTFYAQPGTIITVAGTEDEENYGPYSQYFRLLTEEEVWTPELLEPETDKHISDNEEIRFKAEAYPGLCMALEVDNEVVERATVNDNGIWEISVNDLASGTHEISITLENLDTKTGRSFDFTIQVSPSEAVIGEIVPLFDSQNKSYTRGNGKINSNCTWYAAEAVKTYSNEKLLCAGLGNAYEWGKNAINKSYVRKVDRIPEVGSVIVFDWGIDSEGNHGGHVAFIEKVEYSESNRVSLTWSEENYGNTTLSWSNYERIVSNDDSVYRWRVYKDFQINEKKEVQDSRVSFIHFYY